MTITVDFTDNPSSPVGFKVAGIDGDDNFGWTSLDGITGSDEVILPKDFYAVSGIAAKIYFDSMRMDFGGNNKYWGVSGADVASYGSDSFTDATPVAGTSMLSISQYTASRRLLRTDLLNYIVTDVTQAGTRKVLVIGDSTIAGGQIVDRIQVLANADGVFVPEWIGTITGLCSDGVTTLKHEGLAGRTIAWFYSDPASPFYDASGFDTGFSDYCTANGTPDTILIKLGINDFYNKATDALLDTSAAAALTMLDDMISAFIAENVDVRVGIVLPDGPASESLCLADYPTITASLIKRNFQRWSQHLISHSFPANVYLVPSNLSISIPGGYTNCVHPNASGYAELGNVCYAWMKYALTFELGLSFLGWHDSKFNNATRTDTQTWATLTGDELLQTNNRTEFNGIGLRYGRADGGVMEKRSYRLTARVKKHHVDVGISWGIILWRADGTGIAFDMEATLGSPACGVFTGFSIATNSNLNYRGISVSVVDTYQTVTTDVDLSGMTEDFTSISLHVSGYQPGSTPPGSYVTTDLSQSSIVSIYGE